MRLKALLDVIEYDFRHFFRFRWFVIGLLAMNLADLFRWGTGVEGTLEFNPVIGVLALFIFFFGFTFVGVAFYEKRLEGGSWQ